MTIYPRYLNEYPNVHSDFPLYLRLDKPQVRHITSHRHDFLEISLVLDGKGVETINGTKHPLMPGSFIFLMPYQIHEIHYEFKVQPLLYICNFDIGLLHNPNEVDWGFQTIINAQDDGLPSYIQLNEQEMGRVRPLFESMHKEYESNEPWSKYLMKAKLMESLALFTRFRSHHYHDRKRNHPSMTNDNYSQNNNKRGIWQVVQYMNQHYREEFTLQEMADRFHFNVSHLSEQFKQQLGQNFTHFLHELRIRHACSLLHSSDLTVTTISVEVGFGSFQTFSRIFRNMKGCTPSEYRKRRDNSQH